MLYTSSGLAVAERPSAARCCLQRPAPRLGRTERDGPRAVLAQQALLPRPVDMAALAGRQEAPERLGEETERRPGGAAGRQQRRVHGEGGDDRHDEPDRQRHGIERANPRIVGEHADADGEADEHDDDRATTSRRRSWLPGPGVRRFHQPGRVDVRRLLRLDRAPGRRRNGVVRAQRDVGCGRCMNWCDDRRVATDRARRAGARCRARAACRLASSVIASLAASAGEPGGHGLVVDPLAQQHRPLPRIDALRRHELDRRQLVHLRSRPRCGSARRGWCRQRSARAGGRRRPRRRPR